MTREKLKVTTEEMCDEKKTFESSFGKAPASLGKSPDWERTLWATQPVGGIHSLLRGSQVRRGETLEDLAPWILPHQKGS